MTRHSWHHGHWSGRRTRRRRRARRCLRARHLVTLVLSKSVVAEKQDDQRRAQIEIPGSNHRDPKKRRAPRAKPAQGARPINLKQIYAWFLRASSYRNSTCRLLRGFSFFLSSSYRMNRHYNNNSLFWLHGSAPAPSYRRSHHCSSNSCPSHRFSPRPLSSGMNHLCNNTSPSHSMLRSASFARSDSKSEPSPQQKL